MIDVKDGEMPLWGPYYTWSENELEVLWDSLKEILEIGKIRKSKSSARLPI
jgi:hypothetical protein